MFGYRQGAKQNDINKIREMCAAGKTAEEISRALMVELSCVQSFVKKFTEKPKAKRTRAKKKAEEEAPEVEAEPVS